MLPTPSIVEGLQRLFDNVWLAGGDEIMVSCPYCHYRGMGHDKSGHLALNFEKGVGHCVRCDAGIGDLREWLKKKKFTGKLPLPRLNNFFEERPAPRYLLQTTSLPLGSLPMGLNEVDSMFGQSLVNKRIEPQDWVDHRLHKCYQGKYSGYVLFPFFEGQNLVYWQGRAADPETPAKFRKLNPFDLELGRACWLYGWSPNIPPESELYIVEGGLDKISAQKFLKKHMGEGHYAFSCNGTAFSFPDDQLHPLNTQFGKVVSLNPSRINILFDPDAYKKAEGLAKAFALCGFENTRACKLADNAGDPNEAEDAAMLQAIKSNNSWEQGIMDKLTNTTL